MFESSVAFARYAKDAAVEAARRLAAAVSGDAARRDAFEKRLGEIVGPRGSMPDQFTIVDGTFDNEGYFFRLAMLLKALGGSTGNCLGVLGRYKARACRRFLSRLGVATFEDCVWSKSKATAEAAAADLLANWRTPDDILASVLPDNLPSSILYDYLLKRQQLAVVDLRHPALRSDLAIFMGEIACAREIVRRYRPAFVVLSHIITPVGAALAWTALGQQATVLLAFGNYGSSRYCRMTDRNAFFDATDRPLPADIAALPEDRRLALRAVGRTYLENRFGGKTADVGGAYAFGAANRLDFDPYAAYGWKKETPIVGVFASNWFDYPHGFGMKNYRDFADWIDVTADAICRNDNVNWLVRGHPCDAYYRGITLADVLARKLPPHVRICEPGVSGKSVMETVAAAVTFHGTVGLEYGAIGKEVLVADIGWYHQFEFCVWPPTRESYVGYLLNAAASDRPFGSAPVSAAEREKVEIFVAMYFCVPDWHAAYCAPDDSRRAHSISDFLRICAEPANFVDPEVATIQAWLDSGSKHYHTFKMKRAARPALALSP